MAQPSLLCHCHRRRHPLFHSFPSSSSKKAQNAAAKQAHNYFSDHSRASPPPLNGN